MVCIRTLCDTTLYKKRGPGPICRMRQNNTLLSFFILFFFLFFFFLFLFPFFYLFFSVTNSNLVLLQTKTRQSTLPVLLYRSRCHNCSTLKIRKVLLWSNHCPYLLPTMCMDLVEETRLVLVFRFYRFLSLGNRPSHTTAAREF